MTHETRAGNPDNLACIGRDAERARTGAPAPARHWNYRVVRSQHETFGETETCYTLHEVHYENGEPVAYSVPPAIVSGENPEELVEILDKMRRAVSEPVLDEARFRSKKP